MDLPRDRLLEELARLALCEEKEVEDWSRPFSPAPGLVKYVNWQVDEMPMDEEIASALNKAFPNLETANLVPSEPTVEQKAEALSKWGFKIE